MDARDLLSRAGGIDPIFAEPQRANWVRLQTLVSLRWLALSGQILATVAGVALFELRLHTGLISLVIAVAVLTNLAGALVYPQNKRLNAQGLTGVLLFDMVHLSILLMLTGGLNNPFASLILAQVAISATVLKLRATMAVCAVAVTLITLTLFFYVPLVSAAGEVLRLPPLFRFGFWAAICTGVIFQASYARRVTLEMTAMADALQATQMALAREQKLTDLGGVVAAAAHELGTPLATIALVSGEMLDEMDEGTDMHADARLIREQAERCRIILQSMGRAGKQDTHMRQAPLSSVVEEAAAPHMDRGATVLFDVAPAQGSDAPEPVIARRPEIIHGIRNLVQNAVDFAEGTVWIDIRWTEDRVSLRIADDGPGYPPDMLPFLGDPFMRTRRQPQPHATRRESYQGMGLGLFIAKTLLERSRAEVTFANGFDRFPHAADKGRMRGALVAVSWPLSTLLGSNDGRGPLDANAHTET